MKRLALYLGVVLLLLVLLAGAGFSWLLGTTEGARFVLDACSGAAGFRVKAAGVEGRLWDRLLLSGVQLDRPRLSVQVDHLELVWEPRRILDWRLEVRRLALAGVRIKDDTPPSGKAPTLTWPHAPGLTWRLSGAVERLELTALRYQSRAKAPVLVEQASTTLDYRQGVLTAGKLSVQLPEGRASGELVAGFFAPLLRIDLALVPAKRLNGLDLLSLQARLKGGREPEVLSGTLALAGRSGGVQRLEFTSELGINQHDFLLRKLRLVRPGEPGSVGGTASLTLTAADPVIALDLTVRDLDLDLKEWLNRPTRLSGTLSFAGTQARYRGAFALTNRGPGWENAALYARYQGSSTALALRGISGKLLDGNLSGRLDLDWLKGLKVRGDLAGRGLNPGRLSADWSGRVNLDLAGELAVPKRGGEARGRVSGRLLESRLHGQQLQGELVAAFAGERLRVDRLLLKGRGFDLRGAGELERRLDLTARVSDLSRLVPGTAGALSADAWVRWRNKRLSGSASGQGSDLVLNGFRVAEARLNARLDDAPGYPVHLEASLARVAAGSLQVATAQLALDGTLAQHLLSAQLAGPQAAARLALSGGYTAGLWSGQITAFSGRDRIGPWELTAPAQLAVSKERLYLAPLALRGKAEERLELAADLALEPTGGRLQATWSRLDLARANSWLSGSAVAGASSGDLGLRLLPERRVALTVRADASGTVTVQQHSVAVERLVLALEGGAGGTHAVLDLALAGGSGSARAVFDSAAPARLALSEQGTVDLRLSELDLALLRPFLPQNLQLDGRLAGVMNGKLLPGGLLELKGNAALARGKGGWHNEGESLEVKLQKLELTFAWRGARGGAGRLQLAAEAHATGQYQAHGERLALEGLALRLDADERGTRANVNLALEGGATLRGSLFSSEPATAGLPHSGDFALEWGGLDPQLVKAWLPGALNLKGTLAGQAKGRLLPGRRLEVTGATEFSQGQAGWRGNGTQLSAKLRSATLSFAWRGESFTGALDLSLAEYGSAQGRLKLPIPARLPVAPDTGGALEGALKGRVREQGLLTALFPGLVQETHGDLDLDLALSGTWNNPDLKGGVQLSKAGAYLPSAGIQVTDLEFNAQLTKDQLVIEGLRAVSGPGHLEGAALFRLKGWQVTSYSAVLNGDRFRTVYLPELQLLTSPHLRIEGEAKRVAITGDLVVPEMLIAGPPTRSVVHTSPDVVLEGAPAAQSHAAKFPLEVEGAIRLALGDKVLVKAEGIDAKLGGEMDLSLKGVDNITSRGEIRVVKGRYRAYGIDLEIVRGRLYYVNDPVQHPTLDILALHTVGDVKAGVTVAGPLGSQVVKLYSEPALPDVDILAYMVLGHPLGSGSGDQASLMAGAASSLLSFGQSESLQEQIKDRLGLSVLGLQTVDQTSTGRMGYKEIAVTPSGLAPKTQTTSQSLLTVGKYLTPKLYLSYGRSLVTGGNLFQLRYDVFRHWQIETQSGSESGADIYYKLEFD